MLKKILITAFSLTLLFLLNLVYQAYDSRTNPPVLGVFKGELTPCPSSPNCVSTYSEKYKIIKTSRSLQDIIKTLQSHDYEVFRSFQNYARLTQKSGFFGFVDDVELFQTSEGIHIRSSSRVGYSDMGVNEKRFYEIKRLIEGSN